MKPCREQKFINRRWVLDKIKSQPCEDCGKTYPPVCMDFDHRDKTAKKWKPKQLRRAGTWRAVVQELAKCDLVCSNCHRIRTATRGDHLNPPIAEIAEREAGVIQLAEKMAWVHEVMLGSAGKSPRPTGDGR